MTGTFIVLEGGEGVGKTTQISLLKKYYEKTDQPFIITREPGGTSLGIEIRKLILSPETQDMDPITEALLFAADRANHVHNLIKPSLEQNMLVICDRYIDSSVAYQGNRSDLSEEEIRNLSYWASKSLIPQMTFILDLDPETGIKRASIEEFNESDRIENTYLAHATKIRESFLNQARKEPHRYQIVDASQKPEIIHQNIVKTINTLIVKPLDNVHAR